MFDAKEALRVVAVMSVRIGTFAIRSQQIYSCVPSSHGWSALSDGLGNALVIGGAESAEGLPTIAPMSHLLPAVYLLLVAEAGTEYLLSADWMDR